MLFARLGNPAIAGLELEERKRWARNEVEHFARVIEEQTVRTLQGVDQVLFFLQHRGNAFSQQGMVIDGEYLDLVAHAGFPHVQDMRSNPYPEPPKGWR